MYLNVKSDFGPFNDRIWINCAHQGPLPLSAVSKAYRAIKWKIDPSELTSDRFGYTVSSLRKVIARLIKANPDDIILTNSASYGLHLIANGFPFKPNDEILLVERDFPSDILPWLYLEKLGVKIRLLKSKNPLPQPEELSSSISHSTRIFCTTWVHSFTGYTADCKALGDICRDHGIKFIVNGSQGIGSKPLDILDYNIDMLTTVGFKWLCGPYGTGFCWIKPEMLNSITYNKEYWLNQMTADDLEHAVLLNFRPTKKQLAKKYDIFGTANFFNYEPWIASINYLLKIGIDKIENHNQSLVDMFINSIDSSRYNIISPKEGQERSTLIFISHKDPAKNREVIKDLQQEKIYIAYRNGNLRLSPHLYNTVEEIERTLYVLNKV